MNAEATPSTPPASATAPASGPRKIPHLRWAIGFMLFLAAILNYIDRQTLSILAPTIQKDLNLTDADYGSVTNYFLVAYTVSMLLSGRLVDALGTRLSMALFITWWSAASMFTATARSLTSLSWCRFLLGMGEAGNWPSSAKAVSEWFPAKERSIAIGFYTMGATLGATIAPILVTYMAVRWGWQATFAVTGALGLLWLLPWLWLYRSPKNHPRITAKELALLSAPEPEGKPAEAEKPLREGERWRRVLTLRAVWLMMIARMLTDPVWYFFLFWYAKYLFSSRGVAQADLGSTWVVFLGADIGSLAGGFLSAFLIVRGVKPVSSRLWAMLICAALMPLAPLIALMPTTTGSLCFAMLLALAHFAWLANLGAMLVDIVPRRLVATAFGVVATGSALGGIAMNKVVVYLIANYSYDYWFYIAAVLHPLAWLVLWFGRRRKGSASAGTAAHEQTGEAAC